jgi:serine protease
MTPRSRAPRRSRPLRHRVLAGMAIAAALSALTPVAAGAASSTYVPGEVVVGYTSGTPASAQAATAHAANARPTSDQAIPDVRMLKVTPGHVHATIARLRKLPGVAYAVPNPIAHISTVPLPNDPGISHFAGGLTALQWNFFGPAGVDALDAWINVAAVHAPGGKGVRIAVLDTGVAYRNLGRFKRSPDFAHTRFVQGWDFVDGTRFPVDRNGHGTHVAGTIAESTNNHIGVTGLAFGASIMPLRVLDSGGYGDAPTIARGVRYAVQHGAQVINLSLEFPSTIRAAEIPEILSAIRYARARNVVVVGASGNSGVAALAYPARSTGVIAVGATTDDRCLASFSNDGVGLALVAPGGGDDADLPQDPNCHPGHSGRDIYQMTFTGTSVARFGLPGDYAGTSMASPHVAATAALIIASRVLGPRPTPGQIECRLKQTATPLGVKGPNRIYGYGLVNAGAATSPLVLTPNCLAKTARG